MTIQPEKTLAEMESAWALERRLSAPARLLESPLADTPPSPVSSAALPHLATERDAVLGIVDEFMSQLGLAWCDDCEAWVTFSTGQIGDTGDWGAWCRPGRHSLPEDLDDARRPSEAVWQAVPVMRRMLGLGVAKDTASSPEGASRSPRSPSSHWLTRNTGTSDERSVLELSDLGLRAELLRQGPGDSGGTLILRVHGLHDFEPRQMGRDLRSAQLDTEIELLRRLGRAALRVIK
jgi:hypothetical protein